MSDCVCLADAASLEAAGPRGVAGPAVPTLGRPTAPNVSATAGGPFDALLADALRGSDQPIAPAPPDREHCAAWEDGVLTQLFALIWPQIAPQTGLPLGTAGPDTAAPGDSLTQQNKVQGAGALDAVLARLGARTADVQTASEAFAINSNAQPMSLEDLPLPADPVALDGRKYIPPSHVTEEPGQSTDMGTAENTVTDTEPRPAHTAAAPQSHQPAVQPPQVNAPPPMPTDTAPAHEVRIVSMRWVQRLPDGTGRLELSLHPSNLGRVEVVIGSDGSSVSATLLSPDQAVCAVLRTQLEALHTALLSAGIVVGELNVGLGGGDRQESPPPRPANRGRAMPVTPTAVSPDAGPWGHRALRGLALNVLV